jgi:3-oxoacyl-[acyl-carrier protein] reductase
MNLKLANKVFLITGASSGLGFSVAESLVNEGAHVIVAARRRHLLENLVKNYPQQVTLSETDVLNPSDISNLVNLSKEMTLSGVFINAGGPPAKMVSETLLSDWDSAYQLLFRWKVDLVLQLLPIFKNQGYGRILFNESISVKQPLTNLVLSTSMRLAVTGFSKTLADEIAPYGITSNILAPGFHETEALNRIFIKKSHQENIPVEQAKQSIIKQIPTGLLGTPTDYAFLATWLLSPLAAYITGQTISVDGGFSRGLFG